MSTTKTVYINNFVSGVRVEAERRVHDNAMGILVWGAPNPKGERSLTQIPYMPYEEGRKAYFDLVKRIHALEDRKEVV